MRLSLDHLVEILEKGALEEPVLKEYHKHHPNMHERLSEAPDFFDCAENRV